MRLEPSALRAARYSSTNYIFWRVGGDQVTKAHVQQKTLKIVSEL